MVDDNHALSWRPIDSAPKDKTWIWGWDGVEVQPIIWIDDSISYGVYTGWAFADYSWGGFLYDGYNEVKIPPTHWHPAPIPPTSEASS